MFRWYQYVIVYALAFLLGGLLGFAAHRATAQLRTVEVNGELVFGSSPGSVWDFDLAQKMLRMKARVYVPGDVKIYSGPAIYFMLSGHRRAHHDAVICLHSPWYRDVEGNRRMAYVARSEVISLFRKRGLSEGFIWLSTRGVDYWYCPTPDELKAEGVEIVN